MIALGVLILGALAALFMLSQHSPCNAERCRRHRMLSDLRASSQDSRN